MSYLIDTNIISEVRKGERCNPYVARWYSSIGDDELYLSVLVLGEIRRGVELARPRDPKKASVLDDWLKEITHAFQNRLLSVNQAVADRWGRMNAKRTLSVVDGLLAATAAVHGLTLVTRNISHVADTGANVINPFDET